VFGAKEASNMSYPSDENRFTLRLEPDLRELLAAEARRQMRSLNSEIKVRLRQTLEPQRRGRPRSPSAPSEVTA
jgi:predicted HicB family RNase H-like nuclease